MKRLWKAIKASNSIIFSNRENIKISITVGLASIVNTSINIISPFLLINTINIMASNSEEKDSSSLTPFYQIAGMVMSYVGLLGLARSIPILRRKWLIPMKTVTSNQLAEKILRHYFDLSLENHLTFQQGQLSQLITYAFSSVQKLAPTYLNDFVPAIFEIIGAISILTYKYGPLSIAIVLPLGFLHGLVSVLFSPRMLSTQAERMEEGIKSYSTLLAAMQNYENAHYFNNVDYEISNCKIALNNYIGVIDRALRVPENSSLTQQLISFLGLAGFSLYVAHRITNGHNSVNDFILLSFYLIQFVTPLEKLGESTSLLFEGSVDLDRLQQFLDVTPTIRNSIDSKDLDMEYKDASLEFKDVSFSYDSKQETITHLSFRVNPGEKVAIVGCTGTGKSTLTKLIYRFYEVNSGEIYIGGQPIRSITLSSLKDNLSIVPQTPFLLNDSLEKNITYGKNTPIDEKEMQEVIRLANLKEYISSLPEKLATKVGNQGLKISGGERQRVAIARAILKKPKILILDEATASLDNNTESTIQDNLDAVSAGITTLVITHRLGTILNADRIIYLKDGQLCEEGSFAELMEKKGEFYGQILTYCSSIGANPSAIPAPKKRSTQISAFFHSPDEFKSHEMLPVKEEGSATRYGSFLHSIPTTSINNDNYQRLEG